MKSKMKNKFLTMIVTLVAILGLMPLSTNGATEETLNRAPRLTFGQIGGEVVKQSDDFKTDGNDDLNVRPNPNGYGTVKVTAKDPDGDGIAYIKYNWDYDLKETNPTILTYHEMVASRTEQIEVPQTNGLHILRICAIDQKGNQSEWIYMPYYIVDQKSENTNITPPVLNQENPEELPRSKEVINAGRKFTVRFNDKESGIYYIAYNWSKTEVGSPDLTEYTIVRQPLNGVVTFNTPKEAKVGEKWTLRVFAANSTFDYNEKAFMTSQNIYFNYTIADLEAPKINLNGQEVIEIPENGTYIDEGATVIDNYDAKKVIYANQEGLNVIGENTYKFTTRGTYTLTYQTTDVAGHASEIVTRTIKVTGESEIIRIIKPDKMNYNYGEDLDLTGACIEVTSKAGEVTNIPVEKEMFTNFDTNRLGAFEATFTYAGQEISYPYMVRDYVKDIVITFPRTEFDYKEELDLTGATVQKIWASNADTIAVPITQSMLGEDFVFESNILGEKTITINYAGIEKDINVMVKDLSAPVITLTQGEDNENGVNEVSLEIDETIDLNDYDVTDNYDTENHITIDVVITSNNVNTAKAGVYTVVYEAVDSHGNKAVKTRKVTVTIDKTELNELIESIKDLEKDDYTDDSWKDLEDALKLPDDTTEDLNNKVEAIEDAIAGLVKKDLDTTEFDKLREEIKELITHKDDYTSDSWKNLEDKFGDAQTAKETGLQSKLDAAVEELKQAIKDLVANPVNQDAIKEIEKNLAENYKESDYTPESWKELQDAINDAKKITDLQSKFDKAVENIKIDEILKAKNIDTTVLDAIKAELEKLNPDDYTETSWNAIQDKIADAESKKLQSEFDAVVKDINLDDLVLKPVISNVQVTTSNDNKNYAKVDDTITVTFTTNVALDLEQTQVTLNSTNIQVNKVEGEENKYQGTFIMNDKCKEGDIRYSILAVEERENEEVEKSGKSGIIFDMTAPVVNLVKGNEELEVKTEYTVSKKDVDVSDNYTEVADIKVEVTTDLDVNVVKDSYTVTYTVTDLAGNVATKTRTIKVQDTTKPVITLKGENPVILELNQETPYEDAGVTVTDNYDTDIESKLVVVNPVDIHTKGEYTITYNVTDSQGNSAEQLTRTVRVLDKTGLKDALSKAEELVKGDYTDEAWKELEDSKNLPETTQQEVDDKKQAIEDAIANLEKPESKKELDKTELNKVIAEIKKLVKTDYTEDSWKNLANKVNEAKNATLQSVLDAKVEETKQAIKDLVAKEVNQGAIEILEEAIKSNYKESDYTPESWKELQDAINDAKKITDLQSKFDKAVENIKIDEILKAKDIDTTALDAIKAELAKLNPTDYSETSWNAIQDKIADAESKELQSEFDEAVKDINLDDLVLKPVISNVQVTTSNGNKNYAKENDTITITFTTNVALDLEQTQVTLNSTNIQVNKVEGEENKYQGTFIMNDKCKEGDIRYSILAVEVRENEEVEKSGKTGIIFDKTAPTISLADGIGDTTVKFGSDYVPSENDVVVTDANVTKVEIATNYNSGILGTYTVTYKATDAAGNESTIVTRNITVEDYATGIELIKPVKLTYNQNEELDVTGGMVKLIMASGATGEIVAMSDANVSVTGFDSTNPGTITLTVTHNALPGNQTSFEVTILDSEKPTIILNGDKEVTIEVGGTYTELGATVEDNIDKTLIPTITGKVDTTKVGTYEIYYNAVDTAGNKAVTEKRTVHVVDTQKPVVTVVGANPQIIEAGSEYVELGATAMDNYDGDITSKIRINSSEVDTTKTGEYEVRYVVSDTSKNQSQVVKRIVKVVDTTAPAMKLNGDSEVTIEVNTVESYDDPGVTITDIVDKSLTATVTGNVDTNQVGDYTLVYNVADAAGNNAEVVTRIVHVVDTTKPVITLTGDAKVTVEVGSTYTDDGATVTDNYDEDIQTKLVTVNQVDTTILGTYTITYNVTDANGNVAVEVTRTVEVVDTKAPKIELVGDKTSFEMIAGEEFTEPEFTVKDNYDKNCEIVKEGDFNPNKEGTYTLTYYAKDHSGNKSENGIEITIKVQAVPPVISFVTDGKETVLKEGDVFKKDTEITFDKGTAVITKKVGNEEETITLSGDNRKAVLADGKYTITATDPSGSKTTINFVVDSTPPVVNLRTGFYDNNVTIEFKNPDDVHSAILISSEGFNEIRNQYDNGITITKQGTYSLFAFDEYGNYTRVDFEIK